MNKLTGIATKIKHFYEIFDKRTYEVFKNIVSSFIFLREHKQGDIANLSGKTLSQIQYFFSKSVWDYKILNNLRLNWIRNKTGDKKSDILLLDSTIVAKSKNAEFSGLTNYFFSNKDKKIVKGFDIFGASIITKSGFKYILDFMIYFKKDKNKLTNNDKRNPSIQNSLWIKLLTKLFSKTEAWLVVLDSGFKGGYIAKWIFSVFKRHFLVRINEKQCYYDKYGNRLKIKNYLKKENAIFVNGLYLWVLKGVKLKSWYSKGIDIETNLIIYHKNGFRKYVVLCTSADIEDIYENMIRKPGDLSWKDKLKHNLGEKALNTTKNENEIYYSFVLLYQKRWSIEVCFRELKTYLGFEKFQLQSYEAIMKYLNICILVHTLLYLAIIYINLDYNTNYKRYIYNYLKEKRNIKNNDFYISFDGLKLFFEMIIFHLDDFRFNFKDFLPNFSISLNHYLSLNNQLILE